MYFNLEKRMRISFYLLIISALTSCSYSLESEGPYRIPQRSTFVLKKPLNFGIDQVAIYFQHGKITPSDAIKNYTPYCILELFKRPSKKTLIKPTRFSVKNAKYQYDVRLKHRFYASRLTTFGGVNPRLAEYETSLFLFSKDQPKINKLTCKHWIDPLDGRFVKIKEMRKALGQFFDLQLNSGPGL